MDSGKVIGQARDNIRSAKQGLYMFEYAPMSQKMTGFKTSIVFTRSTIDILKQLRWVDDKKFEEWASPFLKELRHDPLLDAFHKMRSEIIKEGTIKIGLMSQVLTKPVKRSKTIALFRDGSIQPIKQTVLRSVFIKAPSTHLGRSIKNESAENMIRMYIAYVENMVDDAQKTFVKE